MVAAVSPTEPPHKQPYTLRPCRAADVSFVVALTDTVLRAHSERTWGRFDPDFHRAAFTAAFGKLIASANMAGKPGRLRILPVNTGAQRLYERRGFAGKGIEGDFVYMERAADREPP